MIDFRVEFTSLCRVSTDQNGQVWLNRLADVKNGKYVIPDYFEDMSRVLRTEIEFSGRMGHPMRMRLVYGHGQQYPIKIIPKQIMFNRLSEPI